MSNAEDLTWWGDISFARWDRLLGLRVTQRVHPEIEALAGRRITSALADLDRLALRLLLLEALDRAVDAYLSGENNDRAHREADNIARTLIEAEKQGVL